MFLKNNDNTKKTISGIKLKWADQSRLNDKRIATVEIRIIGEDVCNYL